MSEMDKFVFNWLYWALNSNCLFDDLMNKSPKNCVSTYYGRYKIIDNNRFWAYNLFDNKFVIKINVLDKITYM